MFLITKIHNLMIYVIFAFNQNIHDTNQCVRDCRLPAMRGL